MRQLRAGRAAAAEQAQMMEAAQPIAGAMKDAAQANALLQGA
jgi:hypothetical protein